MDSSIYEHALDLWSKVGLTDLQRQLDKDVIEIKEKESQFLDSRKSLASETKKFKKLASEDKLSQINKIIKQYQQEIDNLTKRSKNSEIILLDIYSKIAEAPDPKTLLQSSAEKLSKTDDTKALRDQLETLEDKLAKYADYDALKGRLLDLEQKSAETLVKRISAKEMEVNKTWEEKQRNWEGREEELQKQIETLRTTNETLQNQVVNGTAPTENIDTASSKFKNSSEYTILTQELESSQSRIFQLQRRNEELSGSLARATSAVEQESQLQSKESKIKQLESENALLIASSENDRKRRAQVEIELNEQLNSLKVETDSYKSEIDTLRMKLNNFSDYNQIKNDLSALKRIEFGADDNNNDENVDSNTDANNTSAGDGHVQVEASLVSANKRLQKNLAELRGKYADKEEEGTKLQQTLQDLKKKVENLESLNRKLESDLDKIEEVDMKFNDTASMMSGVTRQMNNRTGRLSPTSSIVGIPEESEAPPLMSNNTILPIITKQRDRLRQRNSELEKQIRQNHTDKNKIMSEMTRLKNDNTNLYQQLRYLSRNNTTLPSHNAAATDVSGTNLDAESQYLQSYEESLNPMVKFKEREVEYYRRNKLSVWEKLFSSFARIILSNKTTRMLFLFYCIGIHGLIFMMCMYVINLSGYMTPEVGIVKPSNTD